MSVGAPSCAFLGPACAQVARQALRRAGGRGRGSGPALLIRWGAGGAARPGGLPRPGIRGALRALDGALPDGVTPRSDGSIIVVDLPADATYADVVQGLVASHEGPVAVAVEVARCDAIDAVLRTVDELVLVEPSEPSLCAAVEDELRALVPRVSTVPAPRSPLAVLVGDRGQTMVVAVAVIATLMAVAVGLGLVASALGRASDVQGRADVAALAGAKAMADAQSLVYSPDPAEQISSAEYRRRGLVAAQRTAAANDLTLTGIKYLGSDELPTRIEIRAVSAGVLPEDAAVDVSSARSTSITATRSAVVSSARSTSGSVPSARSKGKTKRTRGAPDAPSTPRPKPKPKSRDGDEPREIRAVAEVAVAPIADGTGVGEYTGPLAVRQGQRMRPDVALAFDRMHAAATKAGHPLVIVSGYRSNAEQAALFAKHPDPKWVAPPGKSLHRLGTELDLGPNSAYGWLAANAPRFGFKKRYSWEPWHFGFIRNAGSTSLGYREPVSSTSDDEDADSSDRKATGSAIPSFVPSAYAGMISRASQRWSVGAALLGAQIKAESNFNPRAVSPVGAAGIAQFMPGTAASYGLTPAERFDPAKAIMAQAHLMHDLLRQFGSVPLALAAYNAGPGNVSKCMCIPPFPETQSYVQKILALLGGGGLAAPGGLQIRLVA